MKPGRLDAGGPVEKLQGSCSSSGVSRPSSAGVQRARVERRRRTSCIAISGHPDRAEAPQRIAPRAAFPKDEGTMTETGYPGKQGLYDPQHEHDACGFGFVVDIKGRASHDIVAKALTGAREPRAPRRRRRREEHRRRRRASSSRPRTRSSGGGGAARRLRCRARGTTRRAWCSCRRTRPAAPPARASSRRSCARRARQVLGWRDVPTDNAHARSDGAGEPARDPADPRRPRPGLPGRDELRAEALRDPPARREEGLALRHPGAHALLRPVPLPQDHRLQGHAERAAAPRVLPRPLEPRGRHRASRWSTRASRPTPSRPGRARTRTATSRTTARSTRCAATSTGCTRASR